MTKERERAMKQWVHERVALTEAASQILYRASAAASDLGKRMLQGAHTYLYAVLLADLAREVKREGWIGPAVQLNAVKTKPTDEWLIDHLFDTVFADLLEQGGERYLSEVRRKVTKLCRFGAFRVS